MTTRWLTIVVPTVDGEFLMRDIALITPDDQMAQKICRSLTALDCKIQRHETLPVSSSTRLSRQFDLIVSHQLSPNVGSVQFFERDHSPFVPAIAIIPDSQLGTAAALLDAGFDRCLPESFNMDYLSAVARALTRRSHGLMSSVTLYGALSFNHNTKSLSIQGQPVELTVREAQVLDILLTRVGQIIAKETFLEALDPESVTLNSSAIEVYIHRLRKKISNDILPIRNIKRCGYFLQRFTPTEAIDDKQHVFPYAF